MKKSTLVFIVYIGFVVAILTALGLAMAPVFPGWYKFFLSQGLHPVLAFLYAIKSAAYSANWILIPVMLISLPLAKIANLLIRRYGK